MFKAPVFFSLLVALAGCGPAAEDRATMHARAKVFQDSIANSLRAAMAEAEVPQASGVQSADTSSHRPLPTTTVK